MFEQNIDVNKVFIGLVDFSILVNKSTITLAKIPLPATIIGKNIPINCIKAPPIVMAEIIIAPNETNKSLDKTFTPRTLLETPFKSKSGFLLSFFSISAIKLTTTSLAPSTA